MVAAAGRIRSVERDRGRADRTGRRRQEAARGRSASTDGSRRAPDRLDEARRAARWATAAPALVGEAAGREADDQRAAGAGGPALEDRPGPEAFPPASPTTREEPPAGAAYDLRDVAIRWAAWARGLAVPALVCARRTAYSERDLICHTSRDKILRHDGTAAAAPIGARHGPCCGRSLDRIENAPLQSSCRVRASHDARCRAIPARLYRTAPAAPPSSTPPCSPLPPASAPVRPASRPSLSEEITFNAREPFECRRASRPAFVERGTAQETVLKVVGIAGVHAPAFVERSAARRSGRSASGVAGVHAPAFVERSPGRWPLRTQPGVAGVHAPAFVEPTPHRVSLVPL